MLMTKKLVQESRGQDEMEKILLPVHNGLVGGDGDGSFLISGTDHLEEKIDSVRIKMKVPYLANDQ